MEKNKTDNSLVKNAYIATVGIIISKILGILYVIPFNSFVGEKGGALYGYAYNIFIVFIGISSAGLPLAMSKIISEYNTYGYFGIKERAFKIGTMIAFILGFISFLIMFIFAPLYAHLVLGDVVGGNSVDDIIFVVRVISIALLFVPILSVYRGYFEGHNLISWMASSEVIEQIVRVFTILVGCFLFARVLDLPLRYSIGSALFAAAIGSGCAYLYLYKKKNKHIKLFNKETIEKEPKIKNSDILKKIIIYALPLIMIDIFKSLYSLVDSITVVRTLNGFYDISIAEAIYSVISTWGHKINMIIISFSTGFMISIIPNLTSNLVSNNHDNIEKTINKSFQALLYLIVPMTFGISFLSQAVYSLLYGYSKYGSLVLKIYVFVALADALFITTVTILQVMKHYKMVFISLLSGVLLKIILNVYLMRKMYIWGLEPYYGNIIATILGFSISSLISIITVCIKDNISLRKSIIPIINIFIGSFVMIGCLYLFSNVVPFTSESRIGNIVVLLVYGIVGFIVYFIYTYVTKTVDIIYGKTFIGKYFKKIKNKFIKEGSK